MLQFTEVSTGSIWIVDTQFLQWGRVSAPQSDSESKVLESGKLVPKGFGVYGLEPRRDGLQTIGTYLVGLGNTVKIYIRANVEIKNFTMPVPIRQILYEILSSDPKQIEQSIQEVNDANQGSETTESPRPEEPEVGGSLPETSPGTEPAASEAGVESGNTDVGGEE